MISNKEKRIQNNIKKFVTPFVKTLGDESFLKTWNNSETQEKFAKFISDKLQDDNIKKPINKYILFGLDLRKILEKENVDPKMYLTEISKRWKVLPEHEKEKYAKLAIADKVRYDNERKEKLNIDIEEKKEKKPQVISAYNVFVSQEKSKIIEKNPSMSKKNVITEINNRWKEIKADEEKYNIYESLAKMSKLSLDEPQSIPAPEPIAEAPVKTEVVVPQVSTEKVKKTKKKKAAKVDENFDDDEK